MIITDDESLSPDSVHQDLLDELRGTKFRKGPSEGRNDKVIDFQVTKKLSFFPRWSKAIVVRGCLQKPPGVGAARRSVLPFRRAAALQLPTGGSRFCGVPDEPHQKVPLVTTALDSGSKDSSVW